jgi:tetratricopeptide (TPR) repeat protein
LILLACYNQHMRLNRLHIFILCSTSLLTITGCSSINEAMKGERVAASIAEGDRQEDLGNMVSARKFYDSAIGLAPHSPIPYLGSDDIPGSGLIAGLELRSDWPTMEQYMNAAVKDPDLAVRWEIWSALAEAQERLGDASDAKISYQKVLDNLSGKTLVKGEVIPAGGSASGTAIVRADAEWGAGLHAQSRTDYLSIISSNPESDETAEAQNALAYSEAEANENLPEALGLATKSVAYYRSKEDTGPDLGNSVDTLAWIEHKLVKNDLAVRDFAEALDNSPREPIIHMHLAEVDKALGDNLGAKIEIERAVALSPQDYQIVAAAHELDPQALTKPAA